VDFLHVYTVFAFCGLVDTRAWIWVLFDCICVDWVIGEGCGFIYVLGVEGDR